MARRKRAPLFFFLVALLATGSLARCVVTRPTYTDAFYHVNAASRLAQGDGFVDDYLWNYLDAPEGLPAPSHRYWMPLTSMLAALGMAAFGAPGSYAAAQAPFVLLAAGAAMVSFHLTRRLGGNLRSAAIAGMLTAFGGFFAPRWGAIDTFAPYALIVSLALLCLGESLSCQRRRARYWILAGCLAALGHLTRPDGLLLLLTALFAALISSASPGGRPRSKPEALKPLALLFISYLLLMLPWFLRNLAALGAALPVGGLRGVWISDYNDLFLFAPPAPLSSLSAEHIWRMIEVRWAAALHGVATFIAVEGLIALAPFMLIGWWRHRQHPLLRGFTILAIAIHVVMILVFPLQGSRGGLFHAVAGLFPFWMALGVLGLNVAVDWAAARRRAWHAEEAKLIFSIAALALGAGISLVVALSSGPGNNLEQTSLYAGLRAALPVDAKVIINDPARLYYHLGLGGVAIPNESVAIVPLIAQRYEVEYLVLEHVDAKGRIGSAPAAFQFDVNVPPGFLRALAFEARSDVRLFQIVTD